MGILTMPAALLLIACILLALGRWRLVAAEK
jgi:uncharacterized membrane protein